MTISKTRLLSLTRSKDFLIKHSIIIGTVIILLGTGISYLNTDRLDDYNRTLSSIIDSGMFDRIDNQGNSAGSLDISAGVISVLKSSHPFEEKLVLIDRLCSLSPLIKMPNLPSPGMIPGITKQEHGIVSAFLEACLYSEKEDSKNALLTLAAANARYAHYALAFLYDNDDTTQKAAESLKKEVDLHDSDPARERLVFLYIANEDYDALFELKDDSGFKPFITNNIMLFMGLSRMDWPLIIESHFKSVYEDIRVPMVILALLAGLVWLTIMLYISGSLTWKSLPAKLAIPALMLGVLSTHVTLFIIYWQEHQLGFVEGASPASQFIYCVFGIGLREEAAKLLCFVPLIPFLRKRGDLEILTVAGLVGLGFAIEENISYFVRQDGLSALGRFVTANFLHIALTAMAGLTLTRAFTHKGRHIERALIMFSTVVIIHGLYDAFLIVSALMEYSIFAFTIFVLLGHQYFGLLTRMRTSWRDPISITSIFTFGAVLITGLSYCLYAWQYGPSLALNNIGAEAIGTGVILIMFYREIPEDIR